MENELELSAVEKELTEPQLMALGALLRGERQEGAAKASGVSDRQVRNWLRLPAFRNALRDGREVLLREASTALSSQSAFAVRCLKELAEDPKVNGSARVMAARAVLELTLKMALTDDQAAQIREIREELETIREAARDSGRY